MRQLFLAAMLLAEAVVIPSAQAEGPFTSMFDGTTLAGWTLEGGADGLKVFVQNGAIRMFQPEGGALRGWLRSVREYEDFILRLEYRLLNLTALSGVYIRSLPTSGYNGAWPEVGYQIQVREFRGDEQFAKAAQTGQEKPAWVGSPITGDLMSQPKTDPKALRTRFDDAAVRNLQRSLNEWYTLEIEAVGPQIRVRLNGQPVTEGTVTRHSGYIGLQLERSGVEYRNVTVRSLTPGAQRDEAVTVERRDPGLDKLIAPGTVPELLKGDYFGYTEGPVWVQDGGYLLFADTPGNRIYKWTPDGQLSTFLDKSGFTGTDTSQAGVEVNNGRLQLIVLGSSGTTIDSQGRVVFCAPAARAVKRLEKDGTITVLADRVEGKRFGGPNDLAYRSDGVLYFSDTFTGLRGGANSPLREIPPGLYMLKDGQVRLLDKEPGGGLPNGLAFSPDERYLYSVGQPKLLRYEVQRDGTLKNPQPLIDAGGNIDGVKVDRNGNIYFAGPGGVWVVSPEGRHLGTIRFPSVTNLAFGDADGKTLYITARRDLYRIRTVVGGRVPGPSSR